MGTPPAKELLPDLHGQPLIDFSLELARTSAADPLLISRAEKPELNAYARAHTLDLLLVQPTREWPETLLASESLWRDVNVVLLPDTRFSPTTSVEKMFRELEAGAFSVFATFIAEDLSSWGALATREGQTQICEKPRALLDGFAARPWGFFGFRRETGRALLTSMMKTSDSREWCELSELPLVFELESFEDLTRG